MGRTELGVNHGSSPPPPPASRLRSPPLHPGCPPHRGQLLRQEPPRPAWLPPRSCLPSHPPCHRIRSSPSWIRQEVADTQQAAEKAKEAKAAKEAEASKEQLPSQVLLLPAKRLKVRRGFRLCFELGFQQMVQCIFTEIQSGKLRRGKCF